MALNLFDKNVSVHQGLGDNPNTDNGLSADAIKALFDRPAEDIKAFLNNDVVLAVNDAANNSLNAMAVAKSASNIAGDALVAADTAAAAASAAQTVAHDAEQAALRAVSAAQAGTFMASFGTTKFGEIRAAISANKACFCVGPGFILPMVLTNNTTILFAGVADPENGVIMGYSVTSSNLWTNYTTVYKKSDVVDANSTNDQVPTARAVYDALVALEQRIPEGGNGSGQEIYILADGETLEDAPADAVIVIDPNGEPDEDSYTKAEIDAMLGTYIDEVAALVGGDA